MCMSHVSKLAGILRWNLSRTAALSISFHRYWLHLSLRNIFLFHIAVISVHFPLSLLEALALIEVKGFL